MSSFTVIPFRLLHTTTHECRSLIFCHLEYVILYVIFAKSPDGESRMASCYIRTYTPHFQIKTYVSDRYIPHDSTWMWSLIFCHLEYMILYIILAKSPDLENRLASCYIRPYTPHFQIKTYVSDRYIPHASTRLHTPPHECWGCICNNKIINLLQGKANWIDVDVWFYDIR